MRFWKNFKEKCALDYIEDLPFLSKMNKKAVWSVQIEGDRIDDLIDPPSKIPFTETKYLSTKKEAIRLAKFEADKGNRVEIWELIERF